MKCAVSFHFDLFLKYATLRFRLNVSNAVGRFHVDTGAIMRVLSPSRYAVQIPTFDRNGRGRKCKFCSFFLRAL